MPESLSSSSKGVHDLSANNSEIVQYSVVGGVGFILGIGVSSELNIGLGGAELAPALGAIVSCTTLAAGKALYAGWDRFRHTAGWD